MKISESLDPLSRVNPGFGYIGFFSNVVHFGEINLKQGLCYPSNEQRDLVSKKAKKYPS
jgi:hypothetical protein